MNMKQFQYVLVLSEEKSFVKAADELNISQPSLSQYIHNIEKELGVTLFDRNGGTVSLTDAGKVYIEAGKKILDLERNMREQLSDLSDLKTGTITIGTSPYFSACIMPRIAKEFRKKYPGIQLIVKEMTTAELLDGSNHGQFDICLSLLPIDQREFNYEKITEEEILLAVPSSFPKIDSIAKKNRHFGAIHPTQMNGYSFVNISESQLMQKRLLELIKEYQLTIHNAVTVKSIEAQIEMVKEEMGVALVPSGIRKFCNEEVTFYSFDEELAKREVAVFWKKDRHLNRAIQDLIQVMKNIEW